MFRLRQLTRRSAPLRSSDALFRARSIHAVSRASAKSLLGKDSFEIVADITESAKGLSKHLKNVYANSRSTQRAQADDKRVNIVSKALCDDILERMKPSLLKHSGCDIIDINPGVGIWSSAVHNLLKPRDHYLMEPDHELYTPILQPLLNEKGSTYKLIPKSGTIWGQLNTLLSPEHLPQQAEFETGDPRLDDKNDTLLVLANLGWYPRKKFRAFPSLSLLVVHQFLSAVRAHSLFHRYGLIRMLVWLADDEGKQIIPRNISARRKMAIEAEISCDGIYEIASSSIESPIWKRDADINLESFQKVLKRMNDNGAITPKGRESLFQVQVTHDTQEQNSQDGRIAVHRSWMEELKRLQQRYAAGEFAEFATKIPTLRGVVHPEMARLRRLRAYVERLRKKGERLPPTSDRLIELKMLEERFEAGRIIPFIHPQALLLSKKGERRKMNPEWKLLRRRRGRAEDRKVQGQETRSYRSFSELEAKFKAGGIEPYVLNIVSDPFMIPTDRESKDRESSALEEDLIQPEADLGGEDLDGIRRRGRRVAERTEEYRRMSMLERRIGYDRASTMKAAPLFAEYEGILQMQRRLKTLEGSEADDLKRLIDERTANFNEEIDSLGGTGPETFRQRLDNYRTFQNDPPILYWDRREAEPLQVRPEEFFPEHELCLLDFHPAPLWPVLRKDFPASYDVFEYILSSMFVAGTQSIKSALKALAPGAYEWLHAECPSLTDMEKGGNPDLDLLTVRCLTLEMFREIMEAWMRWPFRPDRFELMRRFGSAAYDPDGEGTE